MRASAESVVLIALFLAAISIKRIRVGKRPGVAVGHKAGDNDIVAGTKLYTVKFSIPLTDTIQIDKRMHAQKFVDGIGDFAAICFETGKQRRISRKVHMIKLSIVATVSILARNKR